MPKTEIETIKADVASRYEIDLGSISEDDKQLKALINAPTLINSDQIYGDAITVTANGPSGLVPDLETFPYADITADPRLYTKRVEQNLDEAIRYLQTCLQLRQQYAETAKLRNDTRFKGEEFFRLDAVHRKEVAAGLYKLPWMEASDERTALEEAVSQTVAQQGILDDMTSADATGNKYSAVLSDKLVNEYVQNSALLARNSASEHKPEVQNGADATARYRTKLEYATWVQTLAAVKANIPQLRGKLTTAQRKEVFLHKDEAFRAHRASISTQLAYLQLKEHCRPNSAINYAERLERQGDLFKPNLVALIQRVVAVSTGLKDNYGVDVPLSVPVRGQILDRLSVWLTDVQNELSKAKRDHRLTVSSVWSTAPIKVTPHREGAPWDHFEIDLVVDTKALPSAKVLLRGVAFEYLGDQQRPISLNVVPPKGAHISTALSGEPDALGFGRVFPISPAVDLKPQHPDALWNGSAIGPWKVQGLFDRPPCCARAARSRLIRSSTSLWP
jgi:hypothetical protein